VLILKLSAEAYNIFGVDGGGAAGFVFVWEWTYEWRGLGDMM